jgi:uncharacterized membrane protein
MKNWPHLLGAFIGLWLLIAPFTFGYTSNQLIHSDLACGIILILTSILLRKTLLSSWIFAGVGFWIGLAPLIFWAPEAACYLNDTLAGAILLVLFTQMQAMPGAVPDSGTSIPEGWTYNPSAWSQRIPIAFLAFLGWMASRYMAAYQLGYIHTVYDPFFGTGTHDVITSALSKSFPISDAGLGAFAYSLEVIATFKGGQRRWRTEPWMVILFGLLAVPLSLVSVLLITLQPIVVGAWCSLCLFTAFCMLIVIALSLDEVIAVIQLLKNCKEKPFIKLLIEGATGPTDTIEETRKQNTFCGISVPWNLALTVFIGALIMALPELLHFNGHMANIDHLLGAFTIVIAMISLAISARKCRYANLILASILLISSILYGPFSIHCLMALAIAALSFRRGRINNS